MKDVWDGFVKLVESGGNIKPVIYKQEYRGLEKLPCALEDAREHRVWGRAVLIINEGAEVEAGSKAKL